MRRAGSLAGFVAAGLMLTLWLPGQALAEPVDPLSSCRSDAMIVFDASGSMGTTDYTLKIPRITAAKNAMNRVLPEMEELRRLGLIVYGEGEYNQCDSIELRLRPTEHAAATLMHEIASINPRGRTPLTESVKEAAEVLNYKDQEATIVLLTDGEETCGGDPCRTAAALKAAAKGLTIHVIGYREKIGGYFTSRCMAELTGGQYIPASNEEELIHALRKTLGCPFVTLDGTAGARVRTGLVKSRAQSCGAARSIQSKNRVCPAVSMNSRAHSASWR